MLASMIAIVMDPLFAVVFHVFGHVQLGFERLATERTQMVGMPQIEGTMGSAGCPVLLGNADGLVGLFAPVASETQ